MHQLVACQPRHKHRYRAQQPQRHTKHQPPARLKRHRHQGCEPHDQSQMTQRLLEAATVGALHQAPQRGLIDRRAVPLNPHRLAHLGQRRPLSRSSLSRLSHRRHRYASFGLLAQARACSDSRRCVRSRRVLWSRAVSGFRWDFFSGVVWGRSPVYCWRSCFTSFRFIQVFSVWLREFWSVVVRICTELCGLRRTGWVGCRAVRGGWAWGWHWLRPSSAHVF